jgi:hypothetical protein
MRLDIFPECLKALFGALFFMACVGALAYVMLNAIRACPCQ